MNFALVSIVVNVVLALALFPRYGFLSVAFATSVATWVQVFLLAGKLYRQKQFKPSARLASRLARITLASAALGGFLFYALQYTDQVSAFFLDRSWIATIAIAGAGMAFYGVLSLAVGAAKLSDYKTLSGSK